MKTVFKKILRWIRNILLAVFALSLFFILLYKYVPVYYTPYMFVKNVGQLFSKEKIHIGHEWKPLREISPRLVQAVIASEDYLFLVHNGFDTNNSNGQLNRGARILYVDNATISQQTARNVFLFPRKSYVNEIMETYFTILMEFVWGKERILEVYLNSVEMGNAVFGAEAIAQKSFEIPASELDTPKAALIAACLINPTELNPAEPTVYLLRRQAKIMGIMEKMIEIEWN
ncbi:MAG: monofunctional biosynthetic peptidoglycan transglycosylase [Candidatus Symbiothrix sp.]|jgi:monofunctional biosynthetic peptidoglycan transglycosylase|nr:monofunctional biosynthetic peptidoglycan transglycosylase [Candidatus Symbiothrix sp.]